MDFLKVTFFFCSLVLTTFAEEQYQNSSEICSICACRWSSDNNTLYMDCVAKQFEKTIANWPADPENIIATFSRNNIQKLQQFPGTKSKLHLTFDNCNISDMDSGLFESSINLYYLDLSHNEITSDVLSTDVFKGPYNETAYEPIAIEFLNLGYNDIHTLHKNVFEHMPNLKYLNLEGNNFRVIDDLTALAFVTIPNLKSLNLANNRLTEVTNTLLQNITNLTELDVSNNDLDFVPMSLSLLQFLEILKLDNNPIVELDDQSFLGLGNLLEVSARNLTEMTRIKTNTFQPCKKLQKLDLSNNRKLKQIDDQAFLMSEKLKELNLSNTNLNTLMPGILNWAELNVLDLTRNQLYCDCFLFNISSQLSEDIKRNKEGPYCKDVRTGLSLEVYDLSEEVCKNKPFDQDFLMRSYRSSPLMRMSLVLLSIIVSVSSVIAIILMYTKWRSWQRNRGYPFASQVVYNPITTNVHF